MYTAWQDQKTTWNRAKNGNIIKSLSSDENYKYLGKLEANNIMYTKELTEREYIKRLPKILKSKLNGRNTIKAINTWATVIRHPARIMNWTQNELEEVD